MKVFKKIISFILTAAIMMSMICVGTVSASAKIKSEFAVNAYDNDDGKGISIVVSGWHIDDLETVLNYINKENYTMSFTVNMNDAVGEICFVSCIINREKDICQLKYGKDFLSLPVSLKGFTTDVTNNNYGYRITIEEDHKICDEIKKVFTSGKTVKINADLQPEGLPFLFPIDMQSGSPYTFPVTPIWGKEVDAGKTEKSISSLSISKVSDYTYTGKARKPSVTVKDSDYTLKKGTDYTLSYKNNKDIGTASITIKGKGKYTGSKTIQFKIVPKKSTLKVTKKSETKAKFTWAAVDGAEKYQIYYSTDGKKYKKLATVSGGKTSVTISKLDFDKYDYKFKIRSYGTDDGKKYYSSFSKTVTVK